MIFSKRMGNIKPSATFAINSKALEMKAQGIKVTSLAMGEPDLPVANHILEAAKAAVDANFSKYTAVPGIVELRRGVCSYYRRCYGVSARPENIIITNGGKQSLMNMMLVLLNEGDDVLVPCPYWTSYPDMIRIVGANPVEIPSEIGKAFHISTEDLEKFRTPKTRMLIFNNPSNPSGASYSKDEVADIAHWCVEHGIFLLADEMYDQLVYEGEQASASVWWEKYPESVAVVNGLSKSFAMPGWRAGFTLAHEEIVRQCAKIQGQMTAHTCSITQKAGVAALEGSYECIADLRETFRRRRDLAMAEIASWPGVVCPKPAGAFYLCVF